MRAPAAAAAPAWPGAAAGSAGFGAAVCGPAGDGEAAITAYEAATPASSISGVARAAVERHGRRGSRFSWMSVPRAVNPGRAALTVTLSGGMSVCGRA